MLQGAASKVFDMDLFGVNGEGFRLGLQWQPVEGFQMGFVYRHRIEAAVRADSATVVSNERGKTRMNLILPSRLGFGMRGDIPVAPGTHIGLAADFEYAFQSQNQFSTITSQFNDGSGRSDTLYSYFRWTDAMTVRLGAEVGLIDNLRVRAGYVFDEQTSNPSYSSAFGTPPADTHTATVGVGWNAGWWEVNAAYAYRTGSYEVTAEDVAARTDTCLTCSGQGKHELQLHGIYLDFSYHYE